MVSVLESNRFFALRTCSQEGNLGKYLQSVYSTKAGDSRIEASADAVAGNPRARFYVEPSKEEDGLVHVRCCYNNKYWVAVKDSGSSCWVVGTAHEPVEDRSSPSCTLFEPILFTDATRFRHPGLKKYAQMSSVDNVAKPYLQLAADEESMSDSFIVLGLSEQKELPKYIAFKQYDDYYMGVTSRLSCFIEDVKRSGMFQGEFDAPPDGPVLVFHTKDKRAMGVMCTILTLDDGMVCIKSNHGDYGDLIWKRDRVNWIVPVKEGGSSAYDVDTLFRVLPLDKGENFIVLRSMSNMKFCRRKVDPRHYEYLSAEETSMSQETELQFEEAVSEHRIYDLKCHFDEARVYNTEPVKSIADCRENDSDSVITGSFTFVQKTAMETTWQSSVSKTIGFQSSLSIGTGEKSPVQINGTITVSGEKTSSEGKGTSESKEDKIEVTQGYTLAPGQRLAAQLVATRTCVDVPYSYRKWSLLSNGDQVDSTHDHDICTVKNNYGFHIVVTSKPDVIKRMMGETSSGGL